MPQRVRRAQTFHEFDDCVTAPLHGFASADDYYRAPARSPSWRASRCPTLCLSSEDDPLIPGESAHRARDAAAADVRFEITPGRAHRLRVRPMALAPALLGGGTIDRVAPRGGAQRPEHVRRAAYGAAQGASAGDVHCFAGATAVSQQRSSADSAPRQS